MKSIDRNKLKKYCLAFRKAIEECEKEHLPVSFQIFPKGACGDSSILLGTFLDEKGFGKFNLISGSRKDSSHFWLENEDKLVVDITADQFQDNNSKVIIKNNSLWHQNNFKSELYHEANLNYYNSPDNNGLKKSYFEICKRVKI